MKTATRPTLPNLREYQARGVTSIEKWQGDLAGRGAPSPERTQVEVLPTGGGKTQIAIYLCMQEVARGGKTIFLVDDVTLVQQTIDRFKQYGVNPGVIAASVGRNPNPRAAIQIASIGTLVNRQIPPGVTLLIIDECHTNGFSPSQRWWHETDDSGNWVHWDSGAFVLGLTASPWRMKKTEYLGQLYASINVIAQPRELIDIGRKTDWAEGLVPPRYVGFKQVLDLSSVRISMGDYRQGDLAVMMDTPEVITNIVTQWESMFMRDQSLKRSMRTLFFGAGVEHAGKVAQAFNDYFYFHALDEGYPDGVSWKMLCGDDDLDERRFWFERMSNNELVGLTCPNLLTKGFDMPEIECVWTAPTRSRSRKTQQEGRAARCAPWIEKKEFWVVDMGLNSFMHGRFDEEQNYDIGPKPQSQPQEAPMKQCGNDACNALVYAFHSTCPECGYEFPPSEDKPEMTGKLVKLLSKEEQAFKTKFARFAKQAKRKKYSPGWALIRTQQELVKGRAVENLEPGMLVKVRRNWLDSPPKKASSTTQVRIESIEPHVESQPRVAQTSLGRCTFPADLIVDELPAPVPDAMCNAVYKKPTGVEMADYWLHLSALARSSGKDEAWCLKWYRTEFGDDAQNPATLNFDKSIA